MPQGDFALRAARVWTMREDGGLIEKPLEDGLVLGKGGLITAVGAYAQLKNAAQADIHDLEEAELCPELVNAHAHLGLSHIPADELILGQGFAIWVQSLVDRLRAPVDEHEVSNAVEAAVAGLAQAGTGLVAEVGGRYLEHVWAALQRNQMGARVFLEALGFGPPGLVMTTPDEWPLPVPDSAWPSVASAGHALYSTNPKTLQRAKAWSTARGLPFSLHLAEDPGETEMLMHGTGPLVEYYRRMGVLPSDYRPPGMRPVAYAHSLGLLDHRTLAVHGVTVSDQDIELLAASGVTVVLCPRSNATIGVGRAPCEKYLRTGVPVALATDGLCSASDLNVLAELRYWLERLEVELPAAQALAAITRTPARALAGSNQANAGMLIPGAPARLTVLSA
ncbi:MAG: amidohydrolase family protein [Okeania sp. SIO3B3]|nr:amidohydrolase family protein [Okeania sp. SIO3B3]